MAKMSLENIVTGKITKPLRMVLYGTEGVGKTTFAANAPNPIFISTEDGADHCDVARFPVPTGWREIFNAIDVLINQ